MKVSILIMVSFFACTVSTNAAYDHIIEEGYSAGLTLEDHETLLMTGGGMNDLDLFDWSSATIEGTDPLVEFSGGIWMLIIAGYSQLDFSGGEVKQFDIGSSAIATLSGGSIDEIWSFQVVEDIWVEGTDPPVWVPDPHIEIICRDWDWNESTRYLTGTWEDFTTFDIYLSDYPETEYGYSPAIDNIFFTPEPATLVLFALGAALIRKRS